MPAGEVYNITDTVNLLFIPLRYADYVYMHDTAVSVDWAFVINVIFASLFNFISGPPDITFSIHISQMLNVGFLQ